MLPSRADLERLVFERCEPCALGERPRAYRAGDGGLVWVHASGPEGSVPCGAAGLQPYLAIFRRRDQSSRSLPLISR